MTTSAVASSIAGALDAWSDVTVAATFTTSDPIDCTEVVIDPEPLTESCYLQLIDAAIRRLVAYRDAFIAAEEADTGVLPPTPLPVPWYGWGR